MGNKRYKCQNETKMLEENTGEDLYEFEVTP